MITGDPSHRTKNHYPFYYRALGSIHALKLPHFRPIQATVAGDIGAMLSMTHTVAIKERIPPDELPATPDDIDLDRIVNDPDYRRAVQELLRRWGICERRK